MSAGPQPESGRSLEFLFRGAMPALALLFAVGLGFTYLQLSRNHATLIERTAVQHAALYSDTLVKFRELYASEVVETARKTDLRITHDYLTEPNAIPLPITLARKFEEDPPSGVTTRMYSPFPFRFPGFVEKGGLKDDFGRAAWDALNEEPERPYYRVEQYRGVPTLRYAVSERMQEQCVTCHNTYDGSPRMDWKVGDVRGVLEVNYPLDQAASLAKGSITETLATLTPMLILALALLGMTNRNHQKHMEALQKRMRAQQQAQETMAENKDLRSQIDTQRKELLRSRLDVLNNEERLFQVLESLPLGVLVLDPSGKTKYANDQAVSLLGESGVLSSSADTDGHLPVWFVAGTDRPYPTDDLPSTRVLEGASVPAMHLDLRRDGHAVPVLVSGAPIYDAGGKVAFAIVAMQDISEEQRLEQKARQAQRMQAVGRLAGSVAHDFNNLLTAIINFVTFAMEDLDESAPAYADLQQVLRAASRGETLTRQLLAFSRQHSVSPHVLEPNVAVTSIEQMLRRLLGEDIELHTHLRPDVPNVRINPGALDQVLVNLAVNARDAMPGGGTLSIETSVLDMNQEHIRRRGMDLAPGQYVCITVSDDGTGMDDATRRQMFDPFFTTKGPGKGTGLGLSTCWGIVRQAGGYISVRTKRAQGTSIYVYLPAVHLAPTEEASEPTEALPRRNVTVMVAEDDDAVRALVVRHLTREGCRVIEAADGQSAEEICLAMAPGTIDVLLTDVVMPRLNGPELVKRVSGRHPGMRVLYMSGYTNDTILEHGLSQSEVELLQKPFTPDMLARKIWAVLDAAPQPHG